MISQLILISVPLNTIEAEKLVDIIIRELVSEIPFDFINSTVTESLLNKRQNNNSNVHLSGGSGDDHIFGGSGDDILKGGSGKDFFDCNEGIDTVLDYDSKEDTVSLNCENIT